MIALIVQQILLGCAAGLLLWAAIGDVQRFRIPDKISLGLAGLFPAYVAAGYFGGAPADWPSAIGIAALVFAGGFLLFHFGLLGGGDVKLLSAVALYAGPQWIGPLLAVTTLAGGLLSLGILSVKLVSLNRIPANLRVVMLPVEGRFPVLRAALRTHAPYGAAIAFGGLFIIYQLLRV